jgi:cell division protein FtsL
MNPSHDTLAAICLLIFGLLSMIISIVAFGRRYLNQEKIDDFELKISKLQQEVKELKKYFKNEA